MKKHTQDRDSYPLVRVVWRDSNMYRYQDSVEYALGNYDIEVITTVGFLIGYRDKNPIVTRDLMNKEIDQRCSVVIPIENIVSMKKIKITGDSFGPEFDAVTLSADSKGKRGFSKTAK